MSTNLPDWFGVTKRQWRQQKRQELRKVIKAWEQYRLGCAYAPGYPDHINTVDHILNDMKRQLSQMNWGK